MTDTAKQVRAALFVREMASDSEKVHRVTSSIENPHLGTTLDDFLAEEGLLESVSRTAASRVVAWLEDQRRRSLWKIAQIRMRRFRIPRRRAVGACHRRGGRRQTSWA